MAGWGRDGAPLIAMEHTSNDSCYESDLERSAILADSDENIRAAGLRGAEDYRAAPKDYRAVPEDYRALPELGESDRASPEQFGAQQEYSNARLTNELRGNLREVPKSHVNSRDGNSYQHRNGYPTIESNNGFRGVYDFGENGLSGYTAALAERCKKTRLHPYVLVGDKRGPYADKANASNTPHKANSDCSIQYSDCNHNFSYHDHINIDAKGGSNLETERTSQTHVVGWGGGHSTESGRVAMLGCGGEGYDVISMTSQRYRPRRDWSAERLAQQCEGQEGEPEDTTPPRGQRSPGQGSPGCTGVTLRARDNTSTTTQHRRRRPGSTTSQSKMAEIVKPNYQHIVDIFSRKNSASDFRCNEQTEPKEGEPESDSESTGGSGKEDGGRGEGADWVVRSQPRRKASAHLPTPRSRSAHAGSGRRQRRVAFRLPATTADPYSPNAETANNAFDFAAAPRSDNSTPGFKGASSLYTQGGGGEDYRMVLPIAGRISSMTSRSEKVSDPLRRETEGEGTEGEEPLPPRPPRLKTRASPNGPTNRTYDVTCMTSQGDDVTRDELTYSAASVMTPYTAEIDGEPLEEFLSRSQPNLMRYHDAEFDYVHAGSYPLPVIGPFTDLCLYSHDTHMAAAASTDTPPARPVRERFQDRTRTQRASPEPSYGMSQNCRLTITDSPQFEPRDLYRKQVTDYGCQQQESDVSSDMSDVTRTACHVTNEYVTHVSQKTRGAVAPPLLPIQSRHLLAPSPAFFSGEDICRTSTPISVVVGASHPFGTCALNDNTGLHYETVKKGLSKPGSHPDMCSMLKSSQSFSGDRDMVQFQSQALHHSYDCSVDHTGDPSTQWRASPSSGYSYTCNTTGYPQNLPNQRPLHYREASSCSAESLSDNCRSCDVGDNWTPRGVGDNCASCGMSQHEGGAGSEGCLSCMMLRQYNFGKGTVFGIFAKPASSLQLQPLPPPSTPHYRPSTPQHGHNLPSYDEVMRHRRRSTCSDVTITSCDATNHLHHHHHHHHQAHSFDGLDTQRNRSADSFHSVQSVDACECSGQRYDSRGHPMGNHTGYESSRHTTDYIPQCYSHSDLNHHSISCHQGHLYQCQCQDYECQGHCKCDSMAQVVTESHCHTCRLPRAERARACCYNEIRTVPSRCNGDCVRSGVEGQTDLSGCVQSGPGPTHHSLDALQVSQEDSGLFSNHSQLQHQRSHSNDNLGVNDRVTTFVVNDRVSNEVIDRVTTFGANDRISNDVSDRVTTFGVNDRVSNEVSDRVTTFGVNDWVNKELSGNRLNVPFHQAYHSDSDINLSLSAERIRKLGDFSKSTEVCSYEEYYYAENIVPSRGDSYEGYTSIAGKVVPDGNSAECLEQCILTPAKQTVKYGKKVQLKHKPNGSAFDGHGLVTIRMKPDAQGRFGFNVKGGADQGMPIIVSRVAPGTPSDLCIPRLNEGDQVLLINGRDVTAHKHEQVVMFIRSSVETHSGELVLFVRPKLYIGDETADLEPDFVYSPLEPYHVTTTAPLPPGGDPLAGSLSLLKEGLESGAALAQFEQLYRKKPGLTMNASRVKVNEDKNRYRDISPYDQTRVKIKTASGDYINANFVNMEIPGSGIVNRYIAAQGPLPNTCVDFWQMVWERHCTFLVMLTVNVERGRVKCHKYWPDLYDTARLGDMTVSCVKEEETPSFAFREFSLVHAKDGGSPRHITHMQYMSWPDHGVPEDSSDFLSFVQRVRARRSGMTEPTIVHCSAGIGRTGVLITMETAMCLIEANQPVYPLDIVRQMRDQRAMLIQTSSQYKFVCEAILKVYHDKLAQPLDEYKS